MRATVVNERDTITVNEEIDMLTKKEIKEARKAARYAYKLLTRRVA